MNTWQFEIIRQTGWDLWVWVCLAASLVLISYAIFARLWASRAGWAGLGLIGVGVGGTTVVIGVPGMHTPMVGLVWTFVLLVLLSGTFYLNLKNQLGGKRIIILLLMRVGALALLVPMLFEPVIRYVSRPKADKPLLVVVDTSGSMSFPDVQNGPTQIQSVWQVLRPQLEKIDNHFAAKYFTFSTGFDELKRVDELATVEAEGKSTDIVNAITKALAKTSREDAAVILISDGIDNTSANVLDAVRGSKRAVHTVVVGSEQSELSTVSNIAVDNVEAGDDFVVGHETKIKATIKSTALANRVIDVKMMEVDKEGKPAGGMVIQKLVLQPMAEGQVVELPYKPTGTGIHRLRVWVDPIPGERSTVDNRQEFQGLALDPRIKVLYIEGRARPEYRDLNRALGRDPNIELASLLRIQQERFAASGTVEGEPFRQMPTMMEQWKKFDVIILGDLDSSFLTKAQQMAIEQRVSEGGGMIMVGGQNSFGPGSYENTVIEKALPVFVGGVSAGQEKSEFVPRMTEEGAGHAALEGLADWFGVEGKRPKNALPPMRGNVVVPKVKSGAEILLVHGDRLGPDGKPQIVLAVQNYGKGRSAAFTGDTTYLWYLPLRGMGQESPYNRFWGQLVRWLAGEDVRKRSKGAGVEGLLNKNVYQMGENVRLRAMVRDDKGDATRYAQVSINLFRAGEDKAQGKQLPLNPSETRTGMYEVSVPNPDKGDWVAELVASKDGKELGRQELKLTVIPPADEMLKIAANPGLMASVAEATRGFHYPLAQLPSLIDQLIRSDPEARKAQQEAVPLSNVIRAFMALVWKNPGWATRYDLPMQAGVVILLLAGEWILRRRWQLP